MWTTGIENAFWRHSPTSAARRDGPDSESGVVETPQANLVAGMKWFLGTYTGRFNRRHQLSGHLFSGRYKALIVDGRGDG